MEKSGLIDSITINLEHLTSVELKILNDFLTYKTVTNLISAENDIIEDKQEETVVLLSEIQVLDLTSNLKIDSIRGLNKLINEVNLRKSNKLGLAKEYGLIGFFMEIFDFTKDEAKEIIAFLKNDNDVLDSRIKNNPDLLNLFKNYKINSLNDLMLLLRWIKFKKSSAYGDNYCPYHMANSLRDLLNITSKEGEGIIAFLREKQYISCTAYGNIHSDSSGLK